MAIRIGKRFVANYLPAIVLCGEHVRVKQTERPMLPVRFVEAFRGRSNVGRVDQGPNGILAAIGDVDDAANDFSSGR